MPPEGIADPLSPYTDLLDMAHQRGWKYGLGWDCDGWRLDLYEGDDLICRVHSIKSVPDGWRELGALGAVAVARYLGHSERQGEGQR